MEEFFDARDELLNQNMKKGLDRLAACPLSLLTLEAKKEIEWVLKSCERLFLYMEKHLLDWKIRPEARRCFYSGPKSTKQEEGWCLAYGSTVMMGSYVFYPDHFNFYEDCRSLRRAVEEFKVGFAAIKLICICESGTSQDDHFRWACIASEAGDREGFYFMSYYSRSRKTNLDARQWCEKSAMLGNCQGMCSFSEYFPDYSEQQIYWRVRAAYKGYDTLQTILRNAMDLFWSGSKNVDEQGIFQTIYKIGKFVREDSSFTPEIVRKSAMILHLKWKERAQEAVFCWMSVARRLGFYKDVSLLIAQVIWSGRFTDFFKEEDRIDEKKNQEN